MKRTGVFLLLLVILIHKLSGMGAVIRISAAEEAVEAHVLTYDNDLGAFRDENGIWYNYSDFSGERYMAPVGCDNDVEVLKLPPYVRVCDEIWEVALTAFFYGSENLKRLEIPDNLDYLIPGKWMINCPNLDEVTVDPGNSCFSARNGCLYNAAGDSLEMVMPGVRRLVLDDNVKHIFTYVFENCTELRELYISSSVQALLPGFLQGDRSFLEKLEIAKDNPSYMSDEAGNVLTKDGKRLIQLTTKKAEVSVPEGVVEIDADSISGCTNMKILKLPSSIRHIAEPWQFYCKSDKAPRMRVEISSDNPYYCTDDQGNIYNADKTELLKAAPQQDEKYVVASTVKKIGNGAFRYSDIQSIEIPESVSYIGFSAFTQLGRLEKIRIPETVLRIDDYAFSNSPVLTEIRFDSGGCQTGEKLFADHGPILKIYGYSGSDAEESARESEASFISIGDWQSVTVDGIRYALAGDSCSVLEADNLENGNLELPEKIVWEGKEYTLRMIQPKAFRGEVNLKTVQIPDTVEYIGQYAFSDCISLTKAKLPASLSRVEYALFENCSSLEEIVLPDAVTEIDYDAFSECTNLKLMVIPEKVRYIGEDSDPGLFNVTLNCRKLTIYGKKGSLAEAYAVRFAIPFRDVADGIPEETDSPEGTMEPTLSPAEMPTPGRTSAPSKTPAPGRTSAPSKTPVPGRTSAPPKTPVPGRTSAPPETLAPDGTSESPSRPAPGGLSDFPAMPTPGGANVTDQSVIPGGVTEPVQPVKTEGPKPTSHPTDPLLRDDKNQCVLKVISDSGKKRLVSYEGAVKKKKKDITVPDSVFMDSAAYDIAAVGSSAFQGNPYVKKITLGKKVEVIGAQAFSGCRKLATIVIRSKKLKRIGINALKGTAKNLVIYVPASHRKQYRKYFRGKGNALIRFRPLSELGQDFRQKPQIRLTKGVSRARKYVQVKLVRYEGTYAEFYVRNRKKSQFLKLKTKGGTIQKNGAKYRFQYKGTDMTLAFRVRTYQKRKGKRYYSRFSAVVKIKI